MADNTIELTLRWNEDGEPFMYEEDDGDQPQAFRVAVPLELWRNVETAQAATESAWRSLIDSVQGIDMDGQRLATPCAKWIGHVIPQRVWWDIILPASTEENTWPAIDVKVADFPTEPEALIHIANLPEQFAIHPTYAPPKGLPMIKRSTLRVVRWQSREHAGECETCAWPRPDHEKAG